MENKVKRSYSICSSPQSQNLQVGVKAIENGVFSNYVNDALREGDSIEVSAPEGRFVLENNDQVITALLLLEVESLL